MIPHAFAARIRALAAGQLQDLFDRRDTGIVDGNGSDFLWVTNVQ